MACEILTVEQMYAADKFAAENGVPTHDLMENARLGGRGRDLTALVAMHGRGPVRARQQWRRRLCRGAAPDGARLGRPPGPDRAAGREEGDAAEMARRWPGGDEALAPSVLDDAGLVVDAMFGAGLSRPLKGASRAVAEAANRASLPVVAIDVPSGLLGDTATALDGCAVKGPI